MIKNTNQSTNQTESDKLAESWSRMVDGISHNLMSPLVLMRTAGGYLNPIVELVEGYRIAVAKGLIQPNITEEELQDIEDLVPDIKPAAVKMINFLNLLHPYNKQLISSSTVIKVLTAGESINSLLNTYPFTEQDERNLIHSECERDFEFKCAPIFIENLLSNLLSNALLHIKWAEKGEINIWTETDEKYNVIHFKDTADGMHEDTLANVFNRFFAKRNDEVMPGLGFCRLALLQLGGDVLCTSVKNEFTHFVIKFPSF